MTGRYDDLLGKYLLDVECVVELSGGTFQMR